MTLLRNASGVVLVAGAYAAVALAPFGSDKPAADVPLTLACAAVLGIAIVLVATRLRIDRKQQFFVWFAIVFLNLSSVAIEGTLFAPAAAPPSLLSANLLRLALASGLIAGVVAMYYGRPGESTAISISSRSVFGWAWRILLAAAIYLALYLVLGGINYSLVTRPYYEAHAGSLTVPAVQTILLYEPIRGVLMALSLLPLTLALRMRPATAAGVAGVILFIVGGVVPLLPQASLPFYLRIASLWEIFGQNFLTGVACVLVFMPDGRRPAPVRRQRSPAHTRRLTTTKDGPDIKTSPPPSSFSSRSTVK